jgi:unsaturated chondroitin disaccharide hydrolase
MDSLFALKKSFLKVEEMSKTLKEFPHITKNGEWLTHSNGHWTGGFWIGLQWLRSFYEDNPGPIRDYASNWSKRFSSRIGDNKTHDMGNMKDLYEDRIGLILAWDEPGYEGNAIVDTIMNLPLMVWVAEKTGNIQLAQIARRVADQIMNIHVRPDHSIYHLVKWDPETFEIVEKTTHQGYQPETCWSRGQSWALYGFANMARYTEDAKYSETSRKVAEYFWTHLDTDLRLPRWDFTFKDNKNEPLDASAASIAASGMLLLADVLHQQGNTAESDIWQQRGETIVSALIDYCFYSDIHKYGIIEQATVDKPRNSGVNESTMYGDYYFVEALFRMVNKGNREMLDLLY